MRLLIAASVSAATCYDVMLITTRGGFYTEVTTGLTTTTYYT